MSVCVRVCVCVCVCLGRALRVVGSNHQAGKQLKHESSEGASIKYHTRSTEEMVYFRFSGHLSVCMLPLAFLIVCCWVRSCKPPQLNLSPSPSLLPLTPTLPPTIPTTTVHSPPHISNHTLLVNRGANLSFRLAFSIGLNVFAVRHPHATNFNAQPSDHFLFFIINIFRFSFLGTSEHLFWLQCFLLS